LLLAKKRLSAAVITLTMFLVGAIAADASDVTPQLQYRLYIPKITLSADRFERLEEFHLTVACGHIEALQFVPYDWDISMDRVSAVDRLHQTAGHGATRLGGTEEFSGTILISGVGESCFDVSTAVVISGSGKYWQKKRWVKFGRSSLKLVLVQ
jgi:hypothetical protein